VPGTGSTLLDLCMRCGNCEEVCQAGIPHLPLYEALQAASDRARPRDVERHTAIVAAVRGSQRYRRDFLDLRGGMYLRRTPVALPGVTRYLVLRSENDELSLGVEIIARRFVPVLLRTWDSVVGEVQPGAGRPFLGIYVPAHADNRQMAQRSLIGPDERFVTGGMVELDTGSARYLIRFTQTLERQPGWTWTLFSAVRKLTP
jgi:ferredoxin